MTLSPDQILDLKTLGSLTEVFVEDLELLAHIGVYSHEHGRTQPLIISVHAWADVSAEDDALSNTVNYRKFVEAASSLAASGHFDLVETFINQLADIIMSDTRIKIIKVRASKPEAIENATGAGAAITRLR